MFKNCYSYFKYCYIILFQFSNTAGIFQSFSNKILIQKLYISIIIYLNDIFIYLENLSAIDINVINLF